ncbi:MAG: geranylgeranyl diphosphate synthase type I [Myxococcota bacterium]|jgi:geranylgeranyl diphosphate synthase type I
MTDWIRADFEGPMDTVQALIEAEIGGLDGGWAEGALWSCAIDAVLAIARGPRRMVRPQLSLLGISGAGGALSEESSVRFAAGVELLHLFALIHDDVMDRGTVRRGQPTLQRALLGQLPRSERAKAEHFAVLVGDLLHSQAVALLVTAGGGSQEALRVILAGSRRAGVGQFLDLQGWDGPIGELPPAAFRQLLLNKGGHHSITAPLVAGWRLVEPAAGLMTLGAWGDHIGLAFQGLDDLQDVLAEPGTTGKDNLQDLREGRLSLVSHLLRRHLAPHEWQELRPALGRGMMTVEDRGQIFSLMRYHKLIDRGLGFVREELSAARRLRDGGTLPVDFAAGLAEVEARLEAYAARLERLPRPM